MNPSNSIYPVFARHAARLLHATVPTNRLRFVMKPTPLLVAAFVLVTLSRAFAGNTIVCPSARTGNDTVDWSQLGPPGTFVNSGFTATASPVPITLTGSFFGGRGLPIGQVLQEGSGGSGGFLGDFAIGDNLLSTVNYFSSLTLQFSAGISQVGTQVDLLNSGIPRQVIITAYDQSSKQLGTCTVQADNQGKQDNSAPYIGIAEVDGNNNPVAGIYAVEIGTYDLPIVINRLSLTAVGPSTDNCTAYCSPTDARGTSDPSKCVRPPKRAKIGPYEDVVDGPVNLLYPGVDTSTDDWYVDNPTLFPCPSIGGTAPPRNDPTIPGVPDPAATNMLAERLAAQLPGFLHFSGPFPPMVPDNYIYPEGTLLKRSCKDTSEGGFYYQNLIFCMALDSSPFHGKDIIYVHGFFLDVIEGVLSGKVYSTWPQTPGDFAPPHGYWRDQGAAYWQPHIQDFLMNRNSVPRNPKNRYMVVGWSTAQGLETDANAILNQIADAMVNGNGVNFVTGDTGDPRGTVGFCVAGCIVISHSTGGPLTDVAMSFAADPVYRQQQGTGPIGFIPDHVKVHVAMAGAISGSQLATAAMDLAYYLTNDSTLCTVAGIFLQHTGLCDSFYLLQDSVLWDLVPQVMQTQWSSRINDTPVPVLTVAGASDHVTWPLKVFFQRGFDDGVVTMDSACGRTVPIEEWPSGFFSIVPPGLNLIDPRLYDLGMRVPQTCVLMIGSTCAVWLPENPPVEYFLEQNYEWSFSFPPNDLIPRAAGSCAPSKAPWGMIEPISSYSPPLGDRIFNPLTYYNNHYSFITSGEGHYDFLARPNLSSDNKGRDRWESRAVLDPSIYTTNPGALGLVRDALKTAQVQRRRGLPITLFGIHLGYVWKRTYHLVNGIDGLSTDFMAAPDYIYDYVN